MSTNHPSLEYMTTTKIGEKGQLTVPKQFRDDLGLGMGSPFAVLRLGTASFCCRNSGGLNGFASG
jgi:AbrB family looped-hinge helix DNA binding protein